MSSDEFRRELFIECRVATNSTQKDWAQLFNLGKKDAGQSNVSAKETGTRGVNLPEALGSQLLNFLHQEGYDIHNAVFDKHGRLITIPRSQP